MGVGALAAKTVSAWATQPQKQKHTDVPGARIEDNGDVGGSEDGLAIETAISSWLLPERLN